MIEDFELKTCPFCDSDNVELVMCKDSSSVNCENCLAWGPEKDNPRDAAKAWNSRGNSND